MENAALLVFLHIEGWCNKEREEERRNYDVKSWDKLDSCRIRAPLCIKKRFDPETLTDSGFYSVTPWVLFDKRASYILFILELVEYILKELSTRDCSPR